MRHLRLAALSLLLLIVLALFLGSRQWLRDGKRPEDLRGAAVWISTHPADWIAASIVSDRSLDSDVAQRFALWRESHALADRLAPRRQNASAAFVRAGLFHWYELGEADRKAVLAAAVPLLRDEKIFESMHAPLWELTRDLRYLRRANPGTRHAYTILRELAAKNGLFDDYRALREEVRRAALGEFARRRANAQPGELLAMLPIALSAADQPLVNAVLAALREQPLETVHDSARVHALLDYAIRHRLPLDGLQPLVRKPELPAWTRARLALATGDANLASQIEVAHWVLGMKEWTPYQTDRALFAARQGDAIGARMHADRAEDPAAIFEISRLLGLPIAAPPRPAIEPMEIGKEMQQQDLFASGPATLPLTVGVVQSDRIAPYVEIFIDDRLVAEGAVSTARTFDVPMASGGLHRLAVRLANPMTRGAIQRRVRVS